jgi:hypothetical protein
MEENSTEAQSQEVKAEPVAQPEPSSGVSFPTVGQPKKAGSPKTLLILGVLILVGILGYVAFKNASDNGGSESTSSPTPVSVETSAPVSTSTATPADKSKVKIEVQNGTGITGEAAFLQTQLKNLGYTNITVGNASSQNNTTTTVTFAKSLSSSVVDEITKKLKELYKEVEVKTSSTSTIDVLIVTGLRKGATAKPSATPTPKASATPSTGASATPTATATPS